MCRNRRSATFSADRIEAGGAVRGQRLRTSECKRGLYAVRDGYVRWPEGATGRFLCDPRGDHGRGRDLRGGQGGQREGATGNRWLLPIGGTEFVHRAGTEAGRGRATAGDSTDAGARAGPDGQRGPVRPVR